MMNEVDQCSLEIGSVNLESEIFPKSLFINDLQKLSRVVDIFGEGGLARRLAC
jgi:hypothetical protein